MSSSSKIAFPYHPDLLELDHENRAHPKPSPVTQVRQRNPLGNSALFLIFLALFRPYKQEVGGSKPPSPRRRSRRVERVELSAA